MNIREKILAFFENNYKEYTFRDLVSILKINENDTKSLLDTLYDLMCEGKIYHNSRNKYINAELALSNLYIGTASISADEMYVLLKDGRKYVLDNVSTIESNVKDGDLIYFSFKSNNLAKCKKVLAKPDMFLTDVNGVLSRLKRDASSGEYYVIVDDVRHAVDNTNIRAFPGDVIKGKFTDLDGRIVVKAYEIAKSNSVEKVFILENNIWRSYSDKNIRATMVDGRQKYQEGNRVLCSIEGLDSSTGAYLIKPIKLISKGNIEDSLDTLLWDNGFYPEYPSEVKK